MRDALLAGGVIAASAIAALISLDRGQLPGRHFGSGWSEPMRADAADSTPGSHISIAVTRARDASHAAANLRGQTGSAPWSAPKNSGNTTVVVMVPDLPLDNSGALQQPSAWTDRGSAAPVVNFQAPAVIAMSATGGVSTPPISPLGGSLPSSPVSSGAGTNPAAPSSPGGAQPPAQPDMAAHSDLTPHFGFVLLAGGQGDGQFALSRAELFNPDKNIFVAASPMKDARTGLTATVLPGGKVLVAGGEGSLGYSLSSAELYDPVSGKFSVIAARMNTARAEQTATLISGCNCPADGQVLIAGGVTGTQGFTLRSAELYDPATGKFTATGAMKATRARHSATLIASGPLAGNVLIAGGASDESGGDVDTAELYDPATGQFTSTGTMSTPRENHSATWLAPGAVAGALAGYVLVAGGEDTSEPTDSAEVFNPETGRFSPVGAMTVARKLQAAVLLPSGKVLIAGGQSGDESLVSAELFDPAHATFAATAGTMHGFHVGPTATLLENGSALIAGGRSNCGDLYNASAGTFWETGRTITDVSESSSAIIR